MSWPEFRRDRPVLIVANRGNGFVDPVVVTGVLGRLPGDRVLLGRIKVRDRVVLVAPLLEARSRLVAAVRAGTTGQTDIEQNDRGDSEDTDDDS